MISNRCFVFAAALALGCSSPQPTPVATTTEATPQQLEDHCEEIIGPPRVEPLGENIWAARGFDLANILLLKTSEGNVIIDTGMSPKRAAPAKEALLKVSPGPIKAIIYTHSHIDHVGGASVWVEDGTEIWATDRFTEHFFKQYGQFLPAEQRRGAGQFGASVSLEDVPCSGLGRQVDLVAALANGVVTPTHTFSGKTSMTIGDTEIVLVEAHGETDDQLFVWLPDSEALFPGDNWYVAFPNLYTIRGTRPRPVDEWIASLDAMRALDPAMLIPSHTTPLTSREEVRTALRNYRDGIQWVRDSVVRGANRGESLPELTSTITLPAHLAGERALLELYGQVDWSARAIYTNELGWFDGDPANLYPLPPQDKAARTVELMGGPEAIIDAITSSDDPRWALHLVTLLAQDGRTDANVLRPLRIDALRAVAETISNPNGRAYLLQQAIEVENGPFTLTDPELGPDFLAGIPLELVFEVMTTRLKPEQSLDVFETLAMTFTDLNRTVYLTVRYGILEVHWDQPLPGTPTPLVTISTDSVTWRQLALRQLSPPEAVLSGKFEVSDGSILDFAAFMTRFQRGVAGE